MALNWKYDSSFFDSDAYFRQQVTVHSLKPWRDIEMGKTKRSQSFFVGHAMARPANGIMAPAVFFALNVNAFFACATAHDGSFMLEPL